MPDIYDAGGFGGSLNYGGDMRGPAADSADWMTDKSAAQQKYADLSKEEAKATEKLTGDISTAMTEEQTAADTYKKIQAPVLAKPPEFKSPKMTGKDMLGYGTLIAFMGALFGGAAGARGAMVAMTGAMNGIHQGQQEKAQQAYAEYKANMDALHERNSAILQEWQGINQKFANDANARRTAFEMMVAKDKIPLASFQLEKGNVMDAMKAMDAMHLQAMKLQEQDNRTRAVIEGSLEKQRIANQGKIGATAKADTKMAQEVETGWNFWADRAKNPAQLKKDIQRTGGLLNDTKFHQQYMNAQKVYPGETQEQHQRRVAWLDAVAHSKDGNIPPPPAMEFPKSLHEEAPTGHSGPGTTAFTVTPPGTKAAPPGVTRKGESPTKGVLGSDGKWYPKGPMFGAGGQTVLPSIEELKAAKARGDSLSPEAEARLVHGEGVASSGPGE